MEPTISASRNRIVTNATNIIFASLLRLIYINDMISTRSSSIPLIADDSASYKTTYFERGRIRLLNLFHASTCIKQIPNLALQIELVQLVKCT